VLGAADITGYLLDRKLLNPRAVVDGALRIEDVSRLNHVFVVTAERERCLVLKLQGAAGDAGIAREAAMLERLWALKPGGPLASCLPVVVAYDRADGVLVLASAPGARDLRAHHARGRFSRALAREAGRALAQLHAVPPGALDGLPRAIASADVHRPDLEARFTLSDAAVELTRIVQGSDELCAALDALGTDPPADSVIHGDVRWDNCLALRGAGRSRWTRLQLIDWERCGAGDPSVDIGAFIGEYLHAWLGSIPIADPRDPGLLLAHARLPLRRMRPALRAFWDGYAGQRGIPAAALRATLRRSTRFAAVRLVTAALEDAQTRAELGGSALHALPLSQNVLRRPREAAELLGLGAAWAAP
jgi:aminoglycoside phosphotransferase (APT) family kinase protein